MLSGHNSQYSYCVSLIKCNASRVLLNMTLSVVLREKVFLRLMKYVCIQVLLLGTFIRHRYEIY